MGWDGRMDWLANVLINGSIGWVVIELTQCLFH